MKGIKPTMLASAAVICGMLAAPVGAQDVAATPSASADPQAVQEQDAAKAADAGTADIVVTAQRRSESVQRVPIAITVVGEQQLQRQQILQVSDLNRSAPALEFSPPGQTPGSGGYIRGIGTNVSGSTAEGSVGLVVDGVPQGNVPQSALFDINRVEVLRGPQGTLFGQSVSAGVVNISSNAPKLGQWGGSAYAELADDGTAGSQYSRRIGRLVLNVPIGDDAALRVAGHYDSIDGVAYNANTKQDSDRNDRGVRARFLWQPSSTFTLNLIGDYNQVDTRNEPFLTVFQTNASLLTSVLAGCGITVNERNGNSCTPLTPFNHIVQYGMSGQADVELGRHTLTWITAFRHQDQTQLSSIDGLPASSLASSPFPNITYGGPGGFDTKPQFTQEIRLTSPSGQTLEYVFGGFYSRYTETRNYINNLQLPFLPVAINTNYRLTPTVESFAGFGNLTFNVSDALRLIAGGRFTRNEVTSRRQTLTGGTPGYYVGSSTVNNFSFRAGAQYDLAARMMLYATVSRGFKGQTYNEDVNLSANPIYIRPEKPLAFEVGLKGRVLDTFNFDLNGFYTRVQDYQAQVCSPDAARGVLCVTTNIDKLISKGVELGIFGNPLPGLSLSGGVAYIDARYPDGFLGTDGGNLGGRQIAYSARWKVVASGEYEVPITSQAKLFAGADTVYRSRVRYVTVGRDDVTFRPHFITGARAGVRFDEGKYELAVFGRNLFDVREPALRYDSSTLGSIAAPGSTTTTQLLSDNAYRVVGLQGNVRF